MTVLAYSYERLVNAIAYFANQHEKVAKGPLYKTTLLKYIALFYYKVLLESGEPPLELNFLAMENGPVAEEIYVGLNEKALHAEEFEIYNSSDGQGDKILVKANKYDMDFFSEFEIEIMDSLIQEFATNYKNNKKIIDATHELPPWKNAWASRGKAGMRKMMDEDIFINKEKSLAEEHFAIYKGIKGISNAPYHR
ncbi:type II toxin-antitoxin system antitoxin SocA domain-containing protein [Leptospira sarikeiensis]|uniref:DUF4065 domain-containing protein n=1 Tax=Leptospira sarikeiensis TaxID=2484943 RepID=A0A4R9KBJ4_9LEPT|nr:type II toxin-antitoxin system antitoxin SocA domain-containing protein [Leptospira sarikeiensis]TGL63235.1 DUF4065 domain-containing protein [Leptospira sarikeiensis]